MICYFVMFLTNHIPYLIKSHLLTNYPTFFKNKICDTQTLVIDPVTAERVTQVHKSINNITAVIIYLFSRVN